ncbi:MAG: hypothetical protein MJ197_08785 [Bacteroidales bacterium]|nr:hypothetical protein [Bacteroidales bacterium]
MNYLIKKGHHYATPLELVKKFLGIRCAVNRVVPATVVFSPNCRYDVGCDQSDINKLYGFSIGCRHHKNSARIGWRYVPKEDKIELVTYCYRNGVRLAEKHLQWCDFGLEYKTHIVSHDNRVVFLSKNNVIDEQMEVKGISYPLSLYFGGNCKAPNNMNVTLKVDWQ